MDLKEQIKTVISETCTHWLISDDAELKKISKKLAKEFETIINAEIERRQSVPTKNNGLHKHVVNDRTWIVTIKCGEDTADHKVTAPNELAAKIVASSSYNQKRFNILRCVEYGC